MNRGQIAEQNNQNGQTDCRFGSGHSQNKEHKHLPVQILQEMREGNKVRVDGKQHQLRADPFRRQPAYQSVRGFDHARVHEVERV